MTTQEEKAQMQSIMRAALLCADPGDHRTLAFLSKMAQSRELDVSEINREARESNPAAAQMPLPATQSQPEESADSAQPEAEPDGSSPEQDEWSRSEAADALWSWSARQRAKREGR